MAGSNNPESSSRFSGGGSGGGVTVWITGDQAADGLAGWGTQVGDLTRLVDAGGGDLALVQSASTALRFDCTAASGGSGGGGGTYSPLFGSATSLTDDATTHEFTVVGGDGSTQVYDDFDPSVAAVRRGLLKSRTDAAGNTTAVTGWDGSGRPTGIQATNALTGASERVTLAYADGRIESATRQRQASGGSWVTVRETEFAYANEANASTALVGTTEKDGAGTVLGETYDRYYGGRSDA